MSVSSHDPSAIPAAAPGSRARHSGETFNNEHVPGADSDIAALPLRTRIALLVLLGLALCLLLWLWRWHEAELAALRAAAAVPGTRSTANMSPAAALQQPGKSVGPDTPVPPAAGAQPAPATTQNDRAQWVTAAKVAEIELLAVLAQGDASFDARRAASRLKPYMQAAEEPVRAAAARAVAPVMAALDAQARAMARSAAEAAADLAAEQDFPAATQALMSALQALPPEAPWTAQGTKKLQALVDVLANRRVAEKALALAEFEKEWRQREAGDRQPIPKEPGIGVSPPTPRQAALLAHRDPVFRQEIAALQARLEEAGRTRQVQQQQQEAALRMAWLGFFARFSAAVVEGDLDAADKLCKPGAWNPVLKGGVSDPQAVLLGCAGDIAALRKLQDLALSVARESKRSVAFSMRRGRVEGTLDGVEGRTLQVALGGGARVGVKIEQMTAGGFASIVDQKTLAAANLQSAMWALSACENPADAANFLPKAYASAKLPLPLHWQERFRLEKFRKLNDDAVKLLRELDAASLNGDPEKVKAALEAVRPVLAALEEFGPLDDSRQGAVAHAAKLLGKAVSARVTLQTGVLPTAEYTGLVTDQISQYRESVQRTDVGVQYGLKVGAAGGVQRVLIRADGLEAALGKARVKRATLELYQIDSPQAVNAGVGLFRLKRPWAPDAGTWMSYDSAKNANWALPGASADADADSKEDAKVTLDNKKNVWRSWDVTAYVQDVLSGKAQNFGFLLRVVNGEPDYHVRFYPETDLETVKDKSLRPRLVLEFEQD